MPGKTRIPRTFEGDEISLWALRFVPRRRKLRAATFNEGFPPYERFVQVGWDQRG